MNLKLTEGVTGIKKPVNEHNLYEYIYQKSI
jgi:hypothetical protein